MGKNNKGKNKNKNPQSSGKSAPSTTAPQSPSSTVTASNRSASQPKSNWTSYGLDQIAQRLVLDARTLDPDTLNQGHKMRMAVAYGLERFWGEHLRLRAREPNKSAYWKATWDELVKIMAKAGMEIPNQSVNPENTGEIREMSEELWRMKLEDQRLAMAVLTQLCDCIVWWTQRYKVGRNGNGDS